MSEASRPAPRRATTTVADAPAAAPADAAAPRRTRRDATRTQNAAGTQDGSGQRPARQRSTPAWMEPPAGPGAALTASEDRDRATLAHFGVALGFIAPLAIWILYRDRGPFTAQEAKEALNFSVPPTLFMVLFFFLGQLPVLGPIFAVLAAITWAGMALYGVMGGSHVNKGRPFRYPFNLRILR